MESTRTIALPTIALPPFASVGDMSGDVQIIEWQDRAVQDLVDGYTSGKRGMLLRGGTGLGKMYIKTRTIRALHEQGLLKRPEGSLNPFPVLWLTPKNVKIQTQRVL